MIKLRIEDGGASHQKVLGCNTAAVEKWAKLQNFYLQSHLIGKGIFADRVDKNSLFGLIFFDGNSKSLSRFLNVYLSCFTRVRSEIAS